ncbi:hypothetical protein ACFTZM_26375, partial [Streptomyces hydrogenans]|uniref:hypothetical protein n=1 Tax=Streptomyces hydrogenans TaxID=1873719 RepID=UPI00363EB6B3
MTIDPAGTQADGRQAAFAPDGETIFSWVRELAAFPSRGAQTIDDRRSVDYLCGKFRGFGLSDIQVQEAESFHWSATRTELTVAGAPIPHSPVVYSFDTGNRPFSTGPDGIKAP